VNTTVRLLSDLAAGFSATAWISGPLYEEYGLKPARANASEAEKEGMAKSYKAFSNVVHIGLAGLALTNIFKFFADDLRKTGSKGYKRWASIGDLVVLNIISVGAATRIMSKKLKTAKPGSPEAQQAEQVLDSTGKISVWLSLALLLTSAKQYKERVKSATIKQ
jgi:hypothetical protein